MKIDIQSLLDSANRWEIAGYVASGIVVVGILIESAELVAHIRAGQLREKRFELIGLLVLTLGLAGEVLTQVQSNNRTGLVIGALNAEASDANKTATEAAKTAAGLGVKVDTLPAFVAKKQQEINGQIDTFSSFAVGEKKSAEKAISDLSRKQAELAKARNDAVAAANEAKADIAKAEDTLAKEAAIRDKVERQLASRTIKPEQEAQIVAALSKYAGSSIVILMPQPSPRPDMWPLSQALSRIFQSAHWHVDGGNADSIWYGIRVDGTPDKRCGKISQDVVDALNLADLDANLHLNDPIPAEQPCPREINLWIGVR